MKAAPAYEKYSCRATLQILMFTTYLQLLFLFVLQNGSNPTALCNDSSIQLPANAGLCASNDTKSSIQDLACCGACGHKSKAKYIIIGIVAGVAAIGIVIALVVSYRYLVIQRPGKEEFPGVYPGPPG